MIRAISAVFALTLVYAMTLASFQPWDLALGAALSAVVLWVFRSPKSVAAELVSAGVQGPKSGDRSERADTEGADTEGADTEVRPYERADTDHAGLRTSDSGPDPSPSGRLAASPSLARRLVGFFPFAGMVIWDILRGTVQVALIVLGIRPLRNEGIVAVAIGERSRLGVAVTGIASTLAPGSVLLDVDWERRVMLFHAIDASDPERIRADFQEMYERYQRQVFP